MGTFDELAHAYRMMDGTLRSLYLDDAIKWMLQVARLGTSPVIERDYAPQGRPIISIRVERNASLAALQQKYRQRLFEMRQFASRMRT